MSMYETDFARWAAEQAGLLRAGLVNSIDFKNLAEEIEDMGKSELRALESRLQVLICHLLKWQFQAERRGASWLATIKEQRRGIERLLKQSPSLSAKFQNVEFIEDIWFDGVLAASRETQLPSEHFPTQPIWDITQILQADFLPE